VSESERTGLPYYLAARFGDERRSRRAYRAAQQQLFTTECDLSAYRFYMGPTWYVAIVGALPTAELEAQLRMILADGEATTLPADALVALMLRRVQQAEHGPWVERHYRADTN
jgi:hypothetical protein